MKYPYEQFGNRPPSISLLLDQTLHLLNLKTDASLARRLCIGTPSLSKIRNGYRNITPELILSIHEETGLPIYSIYLIGGIVFFPQKKHSKSTKSSLYTTLKPFTRNQNKNV